MAMNDENPSNTCSEPVKEVFICYETTTGLDYAKHVKESLKKINQSAFVASEDIGTDEPWRKVVDGTIEACNYFVVIITDLSISSEEVKRELELASGLPSLKGNIISCKEKSVDRSRLSKLPIIHEFQQIDFESKEELARKLISELNKRESAKITSESTSLSVCKSKSTDFKSNMPSIPAYVESIRNNDFFRYITNPMVSRSIPLESLYVQLAISGIVHDPEHRFAMPDWAAGKEYQLFTERRYLEKVKEEMDPEKAIEKWQRIVILGDPGSGKTTLLKYLTLEAANGRLKGELIPFFIALREYTDPRNKAGSLIEFVCEQYRKRSPLDQEEFEEFVLTVRELNERRKALFILDGFDEIPHDRKQGVSDEIGGELNRYVLSSRQVGYTGGILNDKTLEVVELSDRSTRKFIKNWTRSQRIPDHEGRAEGLIDSIQRIPRLKMLARNPLLLSLQCFVYQSIVELGRDMPTRRVDLYREAINGLLKTLEPRGITKDDIDRLNRRINVDSVFADIAFHYFEDVENAPRHIFEKKDLNGDLRRISSKNNLKDRYADLLSDIVFRSEILHPLTMHEYHFLHLTFQEYYVAYYLANQADGIQTIVEKKRDLHWQEIIPLYAGMKSERFQKLMDRVWNRGRDEDIFYNDLFLVGKCLAEVNLERAEIESQDIEEIKNRILELSLRGGLNIWKKGANEVLSHIYYQFEDIDGKIRENLKKEDSSDREVTVEALEKIGGEKAFEHLIPLLEDEDYSVRWRAAEALGEIGDEKAVESLIPLLKHENSYIRRGTAAALGEIGSETAFEHLIPLLKDEDSSVRCRTVEALWKIGDEEAVEPLIPLLKDENSDVRGTTAEALGEIGDEKAVESLIPLLKHEDSYIRRGTVAALGEIGGEKAFEHLIPLLKDENSEVRGITARVLGKMGDEKAFEHLIPLLKDENSDVRGTTAEILGEIGGEKAFEHLIPLLKDENSEVRGITARVLGKMGDEKAFEHLIPLLKDGNSTVRMEAARALGEIEGEDAFEHLIPLLKDDDPYTREETAKALVKIGGEKAFEHLIPLLKDENSSVRWETVKVLGKIGAEKAVEPLIPLLKDEDSSVRESAAHALRKISEKNNLYIPLSRYENA
jgi:HEAT repeat protein